MQRIVGPAALIAALTMAGVIMIIPVSSEEASPSTSPSPTPARFTPGPTPSVVTPAPTPKPTVSPSPSPTPAPTGAWTPPTGYSGSLRPDTAVQVTGTGSCLNVRAQPGLTYDFGQGPQQVVSVNCLPDGFIGIVSAIQWSFGEGPPIQSDGHWWWFMLGQGWVAEDWLTAVDRPLSDADGLIAFIAEDGVHLVNADGSGDHLVYASNGETGWVSAVRWSPDGARLAIGLTRYGVVPEEVTVLITMGGQQLAEIAGLSDPRWSPDGTMLAGLKTGPEPSAVFGAMRAPVIVDVAGGAQTLIGPYTVGSGNVLTWSRDSREVAFTCYANSWDEPQPDGSVIQHSTVCEHGEGLWAVPAAGGIPRVVLPIGEASDTTYYNPSGSPVDDRISVLSNGAAAPCVGYAVISATSGGLEGCFGLSNPAPFFTCGIGSGAGASDWSPDGRLLAYHSTTTGFSGISFIEVASGTKRTIPAAFASGLDFASDGRHITFGADGWVWILGTDGGSPIPIIRGSIPAWQPLP